MKEQTENKTNIHNVRFYNLSPRSINCLAYNRDNCKLALSRSDRLIEIWDLSFAPFLEKIIPGNLENDSIEALGWASGERLFSAGLSGELCEWNLTRLECKQRRLVTGMAIWCLDIFRCGDKKSIAVGTEEGYLNLFDISTDEEILYEKLFDKQDGRILCCKFDHSGEFVVTGSLDAIRIWSAKTGHALHKLTISRLEAKRETIVWTLQVLRDFTIVAGDSRGFVTIWDGKLGTQTEEYQTGRADVFTLAVNEDENIFMCSGVDPVIRIYALTTIKKENDEIKRWVKILQRRVHDHDVKVLICTGERLISGGVDGYLGISTYSRVKQTLAKHGPFLRTPCAAISAQERLILLRYPDFLEVWRLGKANDRLQLNDDEAETSREILSIETLPEKLLQLRSLNDEYIQCASLSPNGKYLIYSTPTTIRAFNFAQLSDTTTLTRIKNLPIQFSSALEICFSSNSKHIFLAKSNNIDIFRILETSEEVDHVAVLDTSKILKDLINILKISTCGQYLIVAGTCRTIAVFQQVKKQWRHSFNLPKYMAPTTAIALNPHAPRLVAAFSDGKIFEYDLEEMRFTCSTTHKFLPNSATHCIENIVYDPRCDSKIILQNDSFLFVLEKVNNKENKIKAKRKENTLMSRNSDVAQLKLKFKTNYEHFVHLDWLAENELVAVGINPVSLIEQLPAALRQKKFGAM